jgi:hypothetical protein
VAWVDDGMFRRLGPMLSKFAVGVAGLICGLSMLVWWDAGADEFFGSSTALFFLFFVTVAIGGVGVMGNDWLAGEGLDGEGCAGE